MLKHLIVLTFSAWLVAACHPRSTHDARDLKSVLACMREHATSDDYALVTKCEPLGQTRKFQGTWLVGFEVSAFRIGAEEVYITDDERDLYELIVPASLSSQVHTTDPIAPANYHISFFGRQSLLPPRVGRGTIVLDRIISIHVVQKKAA